MNRGVHEIETMGIASTRYIARMLRAISVRNHPRPLRRRRFRTARCGHRRAAAGRPRAAAATRRMLEARVIPGAPGLMPRALVGLHRAARAGSHQRKPRCGRKYTRRGASAVGARGRLVALARRPQRVEAAALRAGVVVGRHVCFFFFSAGRATAACRCCRRSSSPAPRRSG